MMKKTIKAIVATSIITCSLNASDSMELPKNNNIEELKKLIQKGIDSKEIDSLLLEATDKGYIVSPEK
jgi:hypothetical protein